MKTSALTSAELLLLKSVFDRTLNAVLPDLLQCTEQDSIDQETAIEVVLDCDRLESDGISGGGKRGPNQIAERAAVKAFRALDYKVQDKIAKSILTSSRYCM
jgi:hypothetical protein